MDLKSMIVEWALTCLDSNYSEKTIRARIETMVVRCGLERPNEIEINEIIEAVEIAMDPNFYGYS